MARLQFKSRIAIHCFSIDTRCKQVLRKGFGYHGSFCTLVYSDALHRGLLQSYHWLAMIFLLQYLIDAPAQCFKSKSIWCALTMLETKTMPPISFLVYFHHYIPITLSTGLSFTTTVSFIGEFSGSFTAKSASFRC